jgi:alpha-1,2-mannosyltransferase
MTIAWRDVWGLRVFANPRFVRVLLSVLVVIALFYRFNQARIFVAGPQWGYDFSAYWLAGRHVLTGQPLYTATQLAGPYEPQQQGQFLYLYPPFLAVAVSPLAALFSADYGAAMAVWALLGTVAVILVVLGVASVERLTRDAWQAAMLVGGAFAFPPLVAELILGNVHVLLLALFAIAWVGTRRGRTGEALAGVAVGGATLVKLFPAVVVVWLLVTRRWRAAVWAVAGAVGLALLTLPIVGLQPWLDYPRAILNLGAPAVVTDALAPSLWLSAIMPPLIARALVLAAALIAVVWSASRLDERASYGIAVGVSVLAAPSVFQHYLAIMVLPLLLGLSVTRDRPPAARLALGASYLAMWPGQQPLLGAWSWVLNRALPTLGAIGVPAVLARWGGAVTSRR